MDKRYGSLSPSETMKTPKPRQKREARKWRGMTEDQIIASPPQLIGSKMIELPSDKIREARKAAQKRKWYQDNKDWVRPKRNEARNERYRRDPAYRLSRLPNGRRGTPRLPEVLQNTP